MTLDTSARAEKEKRSAAFSSVVAAVFLAALKLAIGLLTGSLGILAEAAHSALDLAAALVTFFAVRVSGRPPDEGHLYGHGKVENLSALIETLLLLITCVWIIYEVIQRLFFKAVEIEASIWAFGVMIASILVNVSRSRVLYRTARKYRSQALEADALHFSSDVWSSMVVIVGLGLVWLGQRLGPEWGWLAQGDAIAALVVALIVVYVSLQLGQRAVAVLLDAAPPGLVERIAAAAGAVAGVQRAGPVRVRHAGASTFVDLTVSVDRDASLEEAHHIAAQVEAAVSALLHDGDVVVHVDPEGPSGESLPQTVNAIAAGLGLRAHNIHAHEVRSHYFVDLHVEVPAGLTLAEAHERVSSLEAALRAEMPHLDDVQAHIEPLGIPLAPAGPAADLDQRLRAQVLSLLEGVPGLHGCHDVHLRPGPEGYDVVLHCLADPALAVADAHRLTDEVERRLHAGVPGIGQVLVHIEPEGGEAELE